LEKGKKDDEFKKADELSDPENNDAILRLTTCVRIIEDRKLVRRPSDSDQTILE